MKFVLASLLLLPGLAFADGAGIRCVTEGTLGPVTVTITADYSMLGWPVRGKVVAQGRRLIEVDVSASLLEQDVLGNYKIALNEIDPGTGFERAGGAKAELSVTGELIQPGLVAVGQTGLLKITNHGTLDRIFGSHFELTGCRGVL